MDLLYILTKNYSLENKENKEKTLDFIKQLSRYLIKPKTTSYQFKTDGYFEDLPYELIWEIALFIPSEDLINFMLIQKQYQIIFKNDNFWKEKFYLEFPSSIKFGYPKFLREFLKKTKKSWKEIYALLGTKERYRLFLEARDINEEYEELQTVTFESWENMYTLFYKKIKQLEKLMENFIDLDKFHDNLKLFMVVDNMNIPIKLVDDDYPYFDIIPYPIQPPVYYPFKEGDKSFILKLFKIIKRNIKNKEYMIDRFGDEWLVHIIILTIDNKLRNDIDVMLEVIQIEPSLIKLTGNNPRDNKKIILYAVNRRGSLLEYASERLKKDKQIVLAATKRLYTAFQYAHNDLKINKAFVKKLVFEINYNVFQYAHHYLKDDRLYILELIRKTLKLGMIKYSSDGLKDDMSFALSVIKISSLALFYFSDNIRENKTVVLKAVERDYTAFFYAHQHLRNDTEFVRKLIKKFGHKILKYASNRLRNNQEFISSFLVWPNYQILKYASDNLRKDKRFILQTIQGYSYHIFEYVHPSLKDDKDFIIEIITTFSSGVLKYASNRLKDDRDVIIAAVKINGYALQNASNRLKNDKEIVLIAVKKNKEALKYASERLRNDKNIIIFAEVSHLKKLGIF